MNQRRQWMLEALNSQHGDDAFREAYQQIGPPTTVNARVEALRAIDSSSAVSTPATGRPPLSVIIDVVAVETAMYGVETMDTTPFLKARRHAFRSLVRRKHPGPLLEVLNAHRRPNPAPDDPIEAAIKALQPLVTTDVQPT